MADAQHRARKVLHRLFQRAHGVHVNVIGGLVKQNHIGAAGQHARQVHAVALATRQNANQLLLLGAAKSVATDIRAAIHRGASQLNFLNTPRNRLPNAIFIA